MHKLNTTTTTEMQQRGEHLELSRKRGRRKKERETEIGTEERWDRGRTRGQEIHDHDGR